MQHFAGWDSIVTSRFLQKAEVGVKGARMPLEAGDTDGACSRAYYAMYDAARATLDWAGITPGSGGFKTHRGLIAAFSMHLVKPGLFPAEPGRAIQRAQTVRLVADYEAEPVPHDDAVETVAKAEAFVSTAAALLATSFQGPSASAP
jgi:uncharacterized protein (UPF0332 family)